MKLHICQLKVVTTHHKLFAALPEGKIKCGKILNAKISLYGHFPIYRIHLDTVYNKGTVAGWFVPDTLVDMKSFSHQQKW